MPPFVYEGFAMRTAVSLGLTMTLAATSASAFESTRTLPQGVRNLNLKGVYTTANEKSNPEGKAISLAEPLWKPLKFKNILSTEEDPLKRTQLEGFLLQQGLSKEQSVGDFQANLSARINVWAPILAWGLTDKLTLAVAVPYYSTSTDIQPGFRTNAGANDFFARLTTPSMNNYAAALDAQERFQDAVGRLNNKLRKYSYQELSYWNQSGWGDTTLALKALTVDQDVLKMAVTAGLVAPTGRKENPRILTDLPYGDGQWDLFSQLTFDQKLGADFFVNQFAKYTYQAPDKRVIPWKTAEESIEVPVNATRFKYGDKVDAGVSVQMEQDSTGATGGLGLLYFRKFGDRFTVEDPAVKSELQRWSDQQSQYAQAKVGYTTVPAYRRKEFAAPLSVSLEYRRQLVSRNMPINDFAQMDFNLFF